MSVDHRERAPVALQDGTELLGEYEGSGFQEPQHLVRRADGQVLQLSHLLYVVASCLDGERDIDGVARRVTREFGREVSPENVSYLVDQKLGPCGVLAATESGAPPPPRANPLLALRLRVGLVPERLHRVVTTGLRPLFWPPVVCVALAGLAVLDAWLLTHGAEVSTALREIVYHPQLLLVVSALTVASAAFHEVGHATAARYGGATPGAMGAGIYLVWPVFYTDVTDSYRLGRRGRLRTDLGGIYFNVLFTLAVALVYALSGSTPLVVFTVVAQMEALRQFLPFLRFDGYYVVSDLIGVPNLFAYMRPVLQSITRRGDTSERAAARARLQNLKPWARGVITAWVCITAPVLLVNAILFVILAPRIAGAAWGSARLQLRETIRAWTESDLPSLLNGAVGLVLLAMPVAGTVYLLARTWPRLARGARRGWERRPGLTAACVTAIGVVVVLQVGLVWPDTFHATLQQTEQAELAARAEPSGGADRPASVVEAEPAEQRGMSGAPLPAADPAPRDDAPVLDERCAGPPSGTGTIPGGDRPTWMDELSCYAAPHVAVG